LNAERFENGFGDAKGETVERADNYDAVVTLDFRPYGVAHRRYDFAVDLGRDMFRGVRERRRSVSLPRQQIAALVKDLAIVCFESLLGPIGDPTA